MESNALQSLWETWLSQIKKSWTFSTLSAGRTILKDRPDFQKFPTRY
jgi:hypothetical protein